jgi:ADP-dependent NAD(P)H-hydrate dehydratase / NAD(P)H-hydrate epimerase
VGAPSPRSLKKVGVRYGAEREPAVAVDGRERITLQGDVLSGSMALSAADVRALDHNAEALGVSVAELMENAGSRVAEEIMARYPEGSVLVFCGPGNNGGDGAVAARVLREAGRTVRLLLVGEGKMRSEAGEEALAEAEEAGVPVVPFSDVHLEALLDEADLVVDAMLGIGIEGTLRPPMDRIVVALNDHEIPVFAVDVPTGLGTETPVFAAVTVTFHDRKFGMDAEYCGEIVIADIGIPVEAQRFVGPGDLIARYPTTDPQSHKGLMGKILVVAGGGPYTGAPVLTGSGALATGVDLLYMALPGAAGPVARMSLPEAIVYPLEGPHLARAHVYLIEEYLGLADVLAIGPGLGKEPETFEVVRMLVRNAHDAGLRLVLDADAVNAYAGHEADLLATDAVITPHAGEFKRLTGIDVSGMRSEGRIEAIQGWLGESEVVVLLKGPEDVIVGRSAAVMNRVHHQVMTTGGTGDVLTGVVAALLGRKADPFDAARLAAYLNGAAGLYAFEDLSWGVKGSDLPEYIPFVLAEHLGEPE